MDRRTAARPRLGQRSSPPARRGDAVTARLRLPCTGASTIRGKTDSMTDLIADAVGAMVAAILALRIEQRHTKS